MESVIVAEHNIARDTRVVASNGEGSNARIRQGEVLRIPEVEEQLRVEVRRIALGFIEIRKTVVTEQVMIPVELRREVVEIRRVDDPGGAATVGEAHILKDDIVRIPVFREKAVVQKEIVVISEVIIERTLITDRQTLEESLRKATVMIDDDLDRDDPPAFLDSAQRRPVNNGSPASDRDAIVHPVRLKESD